MKKSMFILVLIFTIAKLYGQNYFAISFDGYGTLPESVLVENLTQGTTVQINGTDILHLMYEPTKISEIKIERKNLTIFPNPMEQSCNIEFINTEKGIVNISIYNIAGKQIITYINVLAKGTHTFGLTGIAAGSYIVSLQTETDIFTGQFVATKQNESIPLLIQKGELSLINIEDNIVDTSITVSNTREIKSIVEMNFTIGDELKFTGIADGFENAILYASPTVDQTYTFVFTILFECGELFTDLRDDNTYQTVHIGNQCWMAEDLKYLPSVVGPSTGSTTIPYYYIYDYDGTNVNDALSTSNYSNYGVLYNWTAVMNGAASSDANPSGVQGICPAGWHLPSHEELIELVDYVVAQGYPNEWDNPDGAGDALKSCNQVDSPLGGNCETSEHPRWDSNSTHYGTDTFGFKALPGGFRYSDGTFVAIGGLGNWWSSTEYLTNWAFRGNTYFNGSSLDIGNSSKDLGFSARCVKD